MKAIVRYKYGKPNVLSIAAITAPKPKRNEVLVKVHYTTVNRTDCGILMGKPWLIRLFTGILKPQYMVPGTDFSGEVVALGPQVKQFNIGDRVWGLNDEGVGSHSELLTIREDEGVVNIPDNVSFEEVVACAEGAHYAFNFINKVDLSQQSRVLLNGSTGGIGSAALQILKAKGVYVTAVCNTRNWNLIKSLGADKLYNYEVEDFTQIERDTYDFIFDAVGKSSFGACKHLLKPKGIYISSELGPRSENLYLPLLTRLRGGKRVIFPIPKNCRRTLLFMNSLLQQQKFKAIIDRRFQPEQIKEAYEYVLKGEKTGSVLLEVNAFH